MIALTGPFRRWRSLGEYDLLGWDLDDVLEGPLCVPLSVVADRAEQVVELPPLTDEERAAIAKEEDERRRERERRAAEMDAGRAPVSPPRNKRKRRPVPTPVRPPVEEMRARVREVIERHMARRAA